MCVLSVSLTALLPEVLGATRADVLVQVVPLVFLQSLVSKLYPAANKLSIRVRRAQAVAVLDLSRLIRVPETHTAGSQCLLLLHSVFVTITQSLDARAQRGIHANTTVHLCLHTSHQPAILRLFHFRHFIINCSL